jgi:hypothetical protein
MTRTIRNFGLTAHITFSVGWFGAVAGFLALSVAGLVSENAQIVRAAYIAMELVSWWVIVPLCLASLLTGLIQSLGTHWGLFGHYWIVAKLLLTIVATIILLLHMQPISYLGNRALEGTLMDGELRGLRIQLLADAGAALLVLLTTITLSVYKPWGRAPYGLSKQYKRNNITPERTTFGKKRLTKYVMLALIILVILMFIILHQITGGLKGH